ncbi:Transmembrane protein 59 [Fukomys damarensis]|uniref:Transmembrane protein 59 n=1 Tax=Fukomys damarensis TaxID=885580 RepID=A0A091CR94_FUKDA|nr:Transmembrane protein 59 [Fukomys damarensis]
MILAVTEGTRWQRKRGTSGVLAAVSFDHGLGRRLGEYLVRSFRLGLRQSIILPPLGKVASCHRACQLTYPLHTYPKEEELYTCQRVFRLFSIFQFVDDGIDLDRAKLECESAYAEACSQSEEQYACPVGCQGQLLFAED